MKYGLVLEGGAMRGLFTAGVLDLLMERGIRFDAAVGVSAGAVFGCNLKSHQRGRVLRYNLRFCRDPRYCSWRSLLLTGCLFGTDFCYRELPEVLDPFDGAAYEADPMKFFLVCTDVESGEAVYRECPAADRECFEWMRASASMPLVSRIVAIGGGKYLDGALADSIPLAFLEGTGCGRNLVVLTQPEGFRKKPNRMMPLLELRYRKYPKLLRAIAARHELYNRQLAYVKEREKAGAALVLRPASPLPISRITHSPEAIRQTWQAGYDMAAARFDEILRAGSGTASR